MIAQYLRFWWQSGNEHGLHSPFVFALYRDVIRSKQGAPSGTLPIEQLRQLLYRSTDTITVTDLGAGSRRDASTRRSVARMARYAQKPPRYAWLLHRLILRFNARYVLELGTSLGLTTAYLADAVAQTSGQLHSFEGCPNTARLARTHLDQLGYSSVNLVVGNLNDTLTPAVARLPRLDLVFFDANHRYVPTIQYFTTCLPYVHNDTLFIFDDIHWSDEMTQAWETIKAHPAVQVTVDLFGVGLIFFRREQPKQHFVLRF